MKKQLTGNPKRRRSVLLTEFLIEVYADGKVRWNGADQFLLWLIRRKPKEGFLPYTAKIHKFGVQSTRSKSNK